jgi:hypothetical protein
MYEVMRVKLAYSPNFGIFWQLLAIMRNLRRFAKCISLLGLAAPSAFAQFTQISLPDAAYTSTTTLIPITAANGTMNVASLTAGSQTLTLSTGLRVGEVGVSGWSTWNNPPDAETATPKVLARDTTLASLTLTLSTPTTTFGFELEPNTFGVFPFTVTFMNGSTTLGTVTRSPDGSAGSLLFAATSSTPITGAVLTATGGGNGYAIAQFRYNSTPPAQPVPTLGEWGMIGLAVLLILYGYTQLRGRGEMRGRA